MIENPPVLAAKVNRRPRGRWTPIFLAMALQFGQAMAVWAAADTVGGGWLGGGVLGQYFSNPTQSGAPAFCRRDVRVNFNWGPYGTPGGSPSPAFAAVWRTNFSVRWTGQLMPRFSEKYIFTLVANSGATLYLWPVSGSKSSALVAAASGNTNAAATPLVAGQTYQVELDYNNSGTTGTPVCQLLWSSSSTPQEVLDTATLAGLNVDTYGAYVYQLYANAMDDSRDEWGNYNSNVLLPPSQRDANGWPTTDATNIVFEGAGVNGGSIGTGTYQLQFQGEAVVSANLFGSSKLLVNGTNYGSNLPFGIGYNAASNLTTATLVVYTNNLGILYLGFQNSRRNPTDTTNTGVTNVKLMRPVTPGSTNSFPVGTFFYTNFENAVQRFTSLRWILNADRDTEWSSRPNEELPAYATHTGQGTYRFWEYMVILANECGKDIHACFPVQASNAYLTNVANLFAYGSDGVNPYNSPQANPVYPPLNPNLRIILEHENEVWNFSFPNWGNNLFMMLQAYTNHSPDWQIVNYDGVYNPGNPLPVAMRWHVLRTLRASDIFRGVFGDAAMDSRIRVIYEYQYDDLNGTASAALPFVDNYFNNADGTNHVATPYPVNHYLWGGGGAVYYGSGDQNGTNSGVFFANAGFETPALAAGAAQTNPPGAAWTFTGTAGIYRGTVTGIGSPPAPPDGSQAAFIQGTGTLSQVVTFSKPGAYALAFQCADSAASLNTVRFYFDTNTLITPNGSYANAPSPDQWTPGSFGVSGQVFNYWATYVFQVTNPGPHTLTIQGLGIGQYSPLNTPPNNNLFIYFDDLQIASADAIFAGGIPGPGYANGQAGSAGYSVQLDSQARYAQAYGLQVVAYEGGWSLGGDFNKTAFQNWCGFYDPRAAAANLSALNSFAQSGSRYYTFGTYETWPGYDTVNAGNYSLVQGIDAQNAALPPTPRNGLAVPNVLTPLSNKWYYNANPGSGTLGATGGWFDWNVLAPVSGSFVITPNYQAGAGAMLEVDGTPVSAGATVTNFLTAGLHSLKLRSTSGAFVVTDVTVAQTGAPNPPTLQSPFVGVGQNPFVTLTWSPAASAPAAQGYLIYSGPASGAYATAVAVGDVSSFTLSPLTNGVTTYFAIVATNASGYSLPSNEINVTPVAPGGLQNLLAWDFYAAGGHAATDGNVAAVASTATAYGIQPSTLQRGTGIPPVALQAYSGEGAMNEQSSFGGWSSPSLAAATAGNAYFEFAAAPVTGNRFSLASLAYVAYQQNAQAAALVLEYSTNGFATPGVAINTNYAVHDGWAGATNTVPLGGLGDLQNTAQPITFRLYGYGFGLYQDKGLGQISGDNLDVMVAGSVFYPITTPNFLSVTNRGGNLQLSWPTNGSLLQATNLTGPWQTNGAASSPFTVSPTNAQMFYRSLTP